MKNGNTDTMKLYMLSDFPYEKGIVLKQIQVAIHGEGDCMKRNYVWTRVTGTSVVIISLIFS